MHGPKTKFKIVIHSALLVQWSELCPQSYSSEGSIVMSPARRSQWLLYRVMASRFRTGLKDWHIDSLEVISIYHFSLRALNRGLES